MKKIVRLISAVICFFQLNVQAEEPKEYTFAINSAVTPLLHAAFINETIKTVERSVAPAKLKVLYVELPELERLIENHQTDFFISTAATIRRYQDLGARDVLTASSPFSKNPNRSEGSLFIVKAGRSDINSISSGSRSSDCFRNVSSCDGRDRCRRLRSQNFLQVDSVLRT